MAFSTKIADGSTATPDVVVDPAARRTATTSERIGVTTMGSLPPSVAGAARLGTSSTARPSEELDEGALAGAAAAAAAASVASRAERAAAVGPTAVGPAARFPPVVRRASLEEAPPRPDVSE